MPDPSARIVVVVPVHDNEATLPLLHRHLTEALGEVDGAWRVLYVDDASTDGSWAWVRQAVQADDRVLGARLGANVGQTRAICVGFAEVSDADVIATIDADLDFDPADLPRFIDIVSAGTDLAAGVRVARTDPLVPRLVPSRAFNLALRLTAGDRVGDAGCGYFAMSGSLARRLPASGHRRLAIRPDLGRLATSVETVPVRYRSRPGTGISSRRRLSIATEVLAVEPRAGLLAAAIAVALAAVGRRGHPAWYAPALAAGTVSGALLDRHRRVRRWAQGDLGQVVERLGYLAEDDARAGSPGAAST